ncbi:MAG: thiamine pyrophosphate-binding protein [Ruminococcus sp.]|nr:thiamine pyrophosphate-binding protein [Ruminococcus sp.]
MKVSDYIASFLAENGIEDVFLVTGGGAMHLNDAIGHHPDLRCICNHHEQACSIAAEGYTRYSGKLAAVCVTSGPGGTNAITGVLGAWTDSIPMFVLSGQVKRETTVWSTNVPLRQLGDQEYNIIASVSPMTKYAVMVTEPTEIRYHLEKALYLATHGRGGPVWLDIPLDVQAAQIDPDSLRGFSPSEVMRTEIPVLKTGVVSRVAAQIHAAKRPVILVGTGVRLSGAYQDFLRAIDHLGIPVVTAWNAHDALPDAHPLSCGRPGTVGTRGGNFVVQSCDLLLVLGCRLNIRQISYNFAAFAPDACKIMVDIDQFELQKPTVRPDLPIWADLRDFLPLLAEEPYEQNPAHAAWLERCRKVNQQFPATLESYYQTASPVNPYVFMTELFRGLDEGDVIVTGNGSACVISFQAAELKRGQRLFTNSGCAAMGYGFPAAIGAAFANHGNRVICLDGDGSFQMNIQELQTVVYHNLPLKIFYLNNNGYHSIRQTQTNLFQPPLMGVCDGNGISFPDMEKISAAYGISYVKISAVSEIQSAVQQVLDTDGAVLCEVMLDPAQNFEPKLSSRVEPDGTITSPPIDDMYPFLEREVYERIKHTELIG